MQLSKISEINQILKLEKGGLKDSLYDVTCISVIPNEKAGIIKIQTNTPSTYKINT